MNKIRFSIIGIITMLSVHLAAFSQQLKLGKNPYIIEKAAVLEMQSDNQGVLFPRIADTALINLLTPSDGMVVYHTASKKLLIRSQGRWTPIAVSADLTADWSVSGNSNGATKKMGNIDNFDLPFITNNTERLRILSSGFVGINTTAPLQQLDVNGSMNLRGALMPNNTAGTSGYLLSSNGVGSAPSWRQLSLADLSDIKLTTPTAGQFMMFSGTKWTDTTISYLSSVDTGNISNFYVKVRSELKAGTGISYDAASGTISASAAATTTEWKLNGNTNGTMLSLGTSDNFSLPFITNGTERMRLTNAGRLGINVTAPSAMVDIAAPTGSNPLNITGLSLGTSSDSLLTIMNGVVKKIAYSSFTASNSWGMLGNAGTSASTNFLGTTDANPLMIRVNNQQSGRIDLNNTFLGYQAGNVNTGANNSGIGYHALVANTTGTYNTGFGYNALPTNVSGSYNIGIGYNADVAGNSSSSIAVGPGSFVNASNAIAVGNAAQAQAASGIAIGQSATVAGASGVAIGKGASVTAAGVNAVAVGQGATASQANTIILGDATNASMVVGVGTSSPAVGAKLDVNGPVALGVAGTLTKNIVNFEATLTASTLSGIADYQDYNVTIPSSSNYLTSVRASVSVSFNVDLPSGVWLASARMISTSVVKIRIMGAMSTITVPSMKAYVSIVEF